MSQQSEIQLRPASRAWMSDLAKIRPDFGNFVEKNDNFCQFFWKKCQVLVNFLTLKWQFSGGQVEGDNKSHRVTPSVHMSAQVQEKSASLSLGFTYDGALLASLTLPGLIIMWTIFHKLLRCIYYKQRVYLFRFVYISVVNNMTWVMNTDKNNHKS